LQIGAVALANRDTSVPLIENEERRGPILGLAPAEFLLAVLFVLLIGLAGLLQYKQSQLDKAKQDLDAVFIQTGQGRTGVEQPAPAQSSEPNGDARRIAEQTLRIGALEAALNDARRERDTLRTENAELRPLQAVADSAAKIDPAQRPVQVLQRAVAVLQTVGATSDPARAIQDLKQQNEQLRQQAAAAATELSQVSRENETLTRNARRERDTMQAELVELRPAKPLVEELKASNEELKRKLAANNTGQIDEARRARANLEKENEALRLELAGLQAFKPIAEAASRIAPGEPPATVVRRALSVMSSDKTPVVLANDTAVSLKAENDELQQKLAALADENQKLQSERVNALRPGAHVDLPSCWKTQGGDTEFLLEVTIKDQAVSVRDIAPGSRQQDPNLRLLTRLPRNTEIRPDTFRAAVAPLYRWSVKQKCRFFVQMQDGTSETSKEIYKKARQMVEGVFYVKHL
jgi:FtsZ-binding cell division protein ZapB